MVEVNINNLLVEILPVIKRHAGKIARGSSFLNEEDVEGEMILGAVSAAKLAKLKKFTNPEVIKGYLYGGAKIQFYKHYHKEKAKRKREEKIKFYIPERFVEDVEEVMVKRLDKTYILKEMFRDMTADLLLFIKDRGYLYNIKPHQKGRCMFVRVLRKIAKIKNPEPQDKELIDKTKMIVKHLRRKIYYYYKPKK